jgi:hypothetical protein
MIADRSRSSLSGQRIGSSAAQVAPTIATKTYCCPFRSRATGGQTQHLTDTGFVSERPKSTAASSIPL